MVFFTTAAKTVSDQRVQLAALDAKDKNFVPKANLAAPGLGAASAKAQEVISNKELMPAFGAAAECQKLCATAAQR